jgi:hypothetical protein
MLPPCDRSDIQPLPTCAAQANNPGAVDRATTVPAPSGPFLQVFGPFLEQLLTFTEMFLHNEPMSFKLQSWSFGRRDVALDALKIKIAMPEGRSR